MRLTPTVAEERAGTLRNRVRSWREEGLVTADGERAIAARLATPWRSYGPFVALLFFFLTACAVAALHLLIDEVHGPTVIAGFGALIVAEILIAKGWFGTGVESALWLAGLFSLIASLPNQGKPEAILVFAAASALAGWRVRNPFFGALAAVLVISYLSAKDWHQAVLPVSFAIALVALVALARRWRRPSTEWLWIAMLLALPVAGYFNERWPHGAELIVLFLAAAAIFLAAGLRMRHHAPLVAAAIALVIACSEWFEHSSFALEFLLAVSGTLLLLTAFAVSRALRGRTQGFVLTPQTLTAADDALQLASVIAVAPHEAQAETSTTGRTQGDGGFGGAGATGDY